MTSQTLRRIEKLEQSMATGEGLLPNIKIVFVSPDGTRSDPLTMEELQQQYRERRQSPPSTNARSEKE